MSKLALDNPAASAGSPLSLLNVIPPDEYQDHVNNSAYTNSARGAKRRKRGALWLNTPTSVALLLLAVGAIATLQYAAAIAQLLGQPPAIYEPWLDAAGRIVIPFNSTGAYHPEYDGYALGKEPQFSRRHCSRVSRICVVSSNHSRLRPQAPRLSRRMLF